MGKSQDPIASGLRRSVTLQGGSRRDAHVNVKYPKVPSTCSVLVVSDSVSAHPSRCFKMFWGGNGRTSPLEWTCPCFLVFFAAARRSSCAKYLSLWSSEDSSQNAPSRGGELAQPAGSFVKELHHAGTLHSWTNVRLMVAKSRKRTTS